MILVNAQSFANVQDLSLLRGLVDFVVGAVGGIGGIIVFWGLFGSKIVQDQVFLRTSNKLDAELESIKKQYGIELEAMRHQNSTTLETLKGELASLQNLTDTLLAAISMGYSSSHARVLDSIQFLWDAALRLREKASLYVFVHSILKQTELESLPTDKIKAMLPEYRFEDFAKLVSASQEGCDSKRPFVGEQLWKLYRVYLAFIGRLVVKMIREGERNRYYQWDKDDSGKPDGHMFEFLRGAFEDIELKGLIESAPLGAVPRIIDALELKMLAEMNELIFGRRLVNMTIAEQQRLSDVLASIERSGNAST